MAYGFNDDKSKFDLADIQQQINNKLSIEDIVVIQGSSSSIQPQGSQLSSYTPAQLANLGIANIDDYVVISSMWQYNNNGSWLTQWANHDELGYPAPYTIELNNTKMYPLQIQLYNGDPTDSAIIGYRIVLMKMS